MVDFLTGEAAREGLEEGSDDTGFQPNLQG